MSTFIIVALGIALGIYMRYKAVTKVHELIDTLQDLGMELEVAFRSNDFSSLDLIVEKSEEVRKSYPFFARFGELKHLRTEFLHHYNQLLTQIETVYREAEIQTRISDKK